MTKSSFFTPWRLACAGVLLLAALIYLPAIEGLFLWDDPEIIFGRGIGGGDSLLHCFTRPFLFQYYRPLISASFYLDNQYGYDRASHLVNPFFYHQTNILVHVLTTGLLIGLLGAAFPGRRAIAFLGGLLFAVQPIQVSAVAWIGGRTDSLCAMFVTGFAWALVAAARSEGGRRAVLTGLSALLFGCALLSKEQAIALLPVIPLAFACFRPEGAKKTRGVGWLATIPFVIVALGFIAAWKRYGAPVKISPSLPFLAQIDQAGQTLLAYALALLTPTPHWMNAYTLDALGAGLLAGMAGLSLILVAVVLFARWMRREPAAAWLLALAALPVLPVANFSMLGSLLIAPYRMGISGVGVAALLGYGFASLGEGAGRTSVPRAWRLAPGILYAVWCCSLTLWGATLWQNTRKIDEAIARYDPHSIHAQDAYIADLMQANRPDQSIIANEKLLTYFFGPSAWRTPETALQQLQANPRILERIKESQGVPLPPRLALARLFADLGAAYEMQRDSQLALNALSTAYVLAPNFTDVLLELGKWEASERHYPQAEDYLRRALRADPTNSQAHYYLGTCLALENEWAAARDEYLLYVRDNPRSGRGYNHLAIALRKLGDIRGAEAAERHFSAP